MDLVFWPTGNPCPDFNGEERRGDNLYSDSVLALERATGRLRWYFQFTPHDLWDWDAQQTPMVLNADWNGTPRKLLDVSRLHALGWRHRIGLREGLAATCAWFVEHLAAGRVRGV